MKRICLLLILLLVLVGCSPSAGEQAAYYEQWQMEYDRWKAEYQWCQEYKEWSEQYGAQWYAQQNPTNNDNDSRRDRLCEFGYCAR